ncbi:MAG: beta strand repeat-containing protein, partial [bacterium]
DVDSPTQTLTVSVTLDSAAKGVFTAASLAASGFAHAGGGVYAFTGTAAQATTAIRALVFDPTDNRVAVANTETTTFTVSATDASGGSVSNAVTTVVSTSMNDAPTIAGAASGQAVNDNATVNPFSGMTIGDADNPAQTLSVSVTLDSAAKGVFTPASLTASGFANAGGGVYTFSGTAAQATTAIRALAFDPTDNRMAVGGVETTSFTVAVTDSSAASASDTITTVVSTSINDAPTIGGAVTGQAVNDNANIQPFSGMTVGDVDSPDQTLTATVTLDNANKGVFTAGSLAASGFSDLGGGVYTFTGTAAQVTAAVRALMFDPANNRVAVGATESTTFTVVVTDTQSGSASNAVTTVVSTSMNDAPTITGAASGQAVNDNATVNPFSGMTIADVDPGQQQTVTVSLDNAAKGVFTPASLAASGFADAGGGVYTFSGTAAQATTAVRALVFQPTVNRLAVGQTESTSFSVVVDDAMAAPVSNSVTTVMTTSVNDTPTVSGAQAGQPVTDVSTVAPFTGVTIADADNPGQILSVSVSVDNAAKGVFTAESHAASGFISAGGGVYAFTGVAADVTAAVRGLVFAPTNNRVNPGSVEVTTFNITVGDGLGSTVNSTTTVVVTPVNDAPQLTLPGGVAGQAVDDSATLQPFSGVTISDADSNQPLTLTVSLDDAAKGVFTPASLASSGFVSTGGGSYRFIGTAAQATEAIRALVFNPTDNRVMPGLTETTVFTVSVNDQYAAPVSDNTASVVSTSINDAPTISGAAAAQTVNDNLTIRPFSGMTIADVDHPAQILDVSVTLDNTAKGAFTPESLTSSGFADVGGGVYTFTGTAAQATAAVRALMFNPADNRVAVNQTEITAFTVVVNDGSLTASNTTTTVVSLSINDAPTIIGAASGQPVNDNATIQPFSGMTIGDVDNPAQTLTVTVTLDLAAKGTFTTASLLATGFTATGPASFVFTGTAAAATTAIGGLVFQPTANRVSPGLTETTVMTVQVNDGTGSPSPSTTTTNSATSVVSTSINDSPPVAGATANQTVTDNALIHPFAGFT